MTSLVYADKPQEFSTILLRLNDEWQKCETVRKKRKYDIEIEEEEEEEVGSQENDAKDQNDNSNSIKNDKSSNGNEDASNKDEDEEFYFDANDKKPVNGESKAGAKKAEPKKEEKPKNLLDFEELDASKYKIKKIHCIKPYLFTYSFLILKLIVRLWSLPLEKIKRCWIAMTTNADNFSAIYLSTNIFCDIVTKYCAKKSKQYFGNGDKKPKALQQRPAVSFAPKPETKNELPIALEEIDQFRFTRSQAKELREGDNSHKTTVKSKENKYLAPTRRKSDSVPEKEEKSGYKYVSQNEKTRSKQEKLDELLAIQESGVRRSERNMFKRKMVIEDDVI